MTSPAPYDPDTAQAALEAASFVPVAQDGLTHAFTARDGRQVALCAALSATRLSMNWALVNCNDCRTTAG